MVKWFLKHSSLILLDSFNFYLNLLSLYYHVEKILHQIIFYSSHFPSLFLKMTGFSAEHQGKQAGPMSQFNCSSFKLVLVAGEATMKLINPEIHEVTIGFLKNSVIHCFS